jgi:hypothetical protein
MWCGILIRTLSHPSKKDCGHSLLMSAFNPKLCLKYLCDYFPLLEELYYKKNFTESELRASIYVHRSPNDPEPNHIVAQLKDLKLIDYTPDADSSYEFPLPVKHFLDFLLRQHRLSQPSILEGYLNAMKLSGQDIEEAIKAGDAQKTRKILTDIDDQIERLRQDSRGNRDSIIAEVLKVKGNLEKNSVKIRYERINYIRTRFVVPLRGILQVHQPIQGCFDSLERIFDYGCSVFDLTPGMPEELKRSKMRVFRLNKDVREDFEEAGKEIEPLYKRLYRESRIARGAATLLDIVERDGVQALGMTEKLEFPVWRTEGLWCDGALENYLMGAKDYDPTAAPPSITSDADPQPKGKNNYIFPKEVRRLLKDSPCDIDDLWLWIFTSFPGQSVQSILKVFGDFLLGKYDGVLSAGDTPVRYDVPGKPYIITSYTFTFSRAMPHTQGDNLERQQ